MRLVDKNSNVKLIDLSGESKHVEKRSSSKRMKMCKVVPIIGLTHKIDAAVVRSGSEPALLASQQVTLDGTDWYDMILL